MAVANLSVKMLTKFLFKELGLQSSLTEISIGYSEFELMEKNTCNDTFDKGFNALNQKRF